MVVEWLGVTCLLPRHPSHACPSISAVCAQVRDLLRNARHNSVMMAYGITAAGKT